MSIGILYGLQGYRKNTFTSTAELTVTALPTKKQSVTDKCRYIEDINAIYSQNVTTQHQVYRVL